MIASGGGAGPGPGAGRNASRPVAAAARGSRRTFLRGAVTAALTCGSLEALAACATYVARAPRIPGYVIDVAPLPPGVQGLVAARAAQLGVAPAANLGYPTLAQRVAAFGGQTERQANGGFDPVYDRYPRDTDLIVVQADASLDPVVEAVTAQGVQAVSYLVPLTHQSAAVTVDSAALGALIANDVAAWLAMRPHRDIEAIFIAPAPDFPASPEYPGPRTVSTTAVEQAIRSTLAGSTPGLRLTTVSRQQDPVRALKSAPNLRIVLCADDLDALEVAQSIRRQIPPARRAGLYVGGLGTPSVGQSGTPAGQGTGIEPWVRELGRDDVLRALATVRLRELANALVDVPSALSAGRAPHDVAIAPVLLKPRSTALADYARESEA